MKGLFLIPGLVCLFLGAVFLLFVRIIRSRQEEMDRRIRARTWGRLTGTGSRTERNYENREHTVYFGIYEYDTADGQHISAASDFGYSDPDMVPGTGGNMVKILYDPDRATEFVLPEEQDVSAEAWATFKRVGITLTVIGIFLTAAAIAGILGFFDAALESLL